MLPHPHLDILWRAQDRGEAAAPTHGCVALQAAGAQTATDPRRVCLTKRRSPERPAPSAAALLPERLSASAYQDLRDCPYRFFALRQLRLQDADELEGEPDQRDMGNWLHAVLRGFHEERGDQRPGRAADTAALERWAQTVGESMGLAGGEGQAGFLPYQAVWPAMREGYLDWLADLRSRARSRWAVRLKRLKSSATAAAGRWRLLGKLDRIDAQPSPEGRLSVVIDYKTESRERTLERVKNPLEDTQLAFYAALVARRKPACGLPEHHRQTGLCVATPPRCWWSNPRCCWPARHCCKACKATWTGWPLATPCRPWARAKPANSARRAACAAATTGAPA